MKKRTKKDFNVKFYKLPLIILIFAALFTPMKGIAQNTVTLNMKNVSLIDFFNEIEKNTNFRFSFVDKQLDSKKDISINVTDEPVDQVLNKVIIPKGYEYTRTGNTYAITKRKISPKITRQYSGLVTDDKSNPIIGATILIDGTNIGTITDINGKFNLEAPSEAILYITYVGYEATKLSLSSNTNLNIKLKEDTKLLDEVVVVGYGTQKKVNISGSVAVVTADQLKDRPAANASQLLQGAVPNMNVTFGSGRPGQYGKFNIRGVNTIGVNTANTQPLILIDGIEGNIDRINPRDIESISVLKDASASSVYGARAAYGVILVTTKNGSSKKATVTYGGKFAFGKPTTSTDYETRGYQSVYIYNLFQKTVTGNDIASPPFTAEDQAAMLARINDKTEHPDRPWILVEPREGHNTYLYYGNTDWYHTLYDDRRPTWEHNININGGTDKFKYMISGNMFDQKGIFKENPDEYKSYNLRSKISADIYPWLSVNANSVYFQNTYSYPGIGTLDNMFRQLAVGLYANYLPYNPDGSYTNFNLFLPMIQNGKHLNSSTVEEITTVFEAVFKIAKGLNIKANFSYLHSLTNGFNRQVNLPLSRYEGVLELQTTGGYESKLTEFSNGFKYYATNVFATYETQIADTHNFKLMGGMNYETKLFKNLSLSRNNLLTNQLNDFQLATGDLIQIDSGQNEYKIIGSFCRLNYDYKNRYIMEVSGRYDGSSRFAKGHRFGFFPSTSVAWRIAEEPFFESLRKDVENLKLRVSYGSLGNQQTGYYDYIEKISINPIDYLFGNDKKSSAASVSAPNASDLTWEVATTSNIGLDIGILKNRMNISGDVYVRNVKNILGSSEMIPSVYGAPTPQRNLAAIRTQGWELSATWHDKFMLLNKYFNYDITVGIGDNISHVTKYSNPEKNLLTYYEGQQLGEIWGYVTDGYFKTDEEAANYPVDQRAVNEIINSAVIDNGLRAGDLKFVDIRGNDNKITTGANTANDPGDRKIIGNSLPRYTYSANFGANWGNIDLSIFLQGVGRQHWYPNSESSFWGPYGRPYQSFVPRNFMDMCWSEDNPNAYFPRPRGYIAGVNSVSRSLSVPQTTYLQNLAYCRLKSLVIGYTLPEEWIKKKFITNCRIYCSGENLLTFTSLKNKFIDPEQAGADNSMNNSSSSAKIYPWSKTFTLGLDITF